MKEYGIVLKQSLVNGLVLDPRTPVNAPYCYEYLNFRCSEHGATAFDSVSALSLTTSTAWPYPVMMRGERGSKVLYVDGSADLILADIDETTLAPGTVNTTSGEGYLLGTGNTTIAPNGAIVNFFNAEDIWFVSNGDSLITNHPLFTSVYSATKWPYWTKSSGYVPRAMCAFGNRMAVAGFPSDNLFDTALWTTVYKEWRAFSGDTVTTSSGLTAFDYRRLLIVSEARGGDILTPYINMAVLLSDTQTTAFQTPILDALRDSRLMFLHLDITGTVQHIGQLGNRLIVYTDKEIVQIIPTEQGLSQSILQRVGVPGRGAVHCRDEKHVWVNNEGDLYYMLNEYIPVSVGGRAQLSTAIAYSCTIQYDPFFEDYYISFYSYGVYLKCFVLTPTGLCRNRYLYTTLHRIGTRLCGASLDGGETSYEITTHDIDFTRRDLKNTGWFEAELHGITSGQIKVDYKYQESASYTRSSASILNTVNAAYLRLAGTDFRIVFEGTPASNAILSRIRVKYQAFGRFIRGLSEQGSEEI